MRINYSNGKLFPEFHSNPSSRDGHHPLHLPNNPNKTPPNPRANTNFWKTRSHHSIPLSSLTPMTNVIYLLHPTTASTEGRKKTLEFPSRGTSIRAAGKTTRNTPPLHRALQSHARARIIAYTCWEESDLASQSEPKLGGKLRIQSVQRPMKREHIDRMYVCAWVVHRGLTYILTFRKASGSMQHIGVWQIKSAGAVDGETSCVGL